MILAIGSTLSLWFQNIYTVFLSLLSHANHRYRNVIWEGASRKSTDFIWVGDDLSGSTTQIRFPVVSVWFFTVRNSSCRKVMFLNLSVSHSVHRGGMCGGDVHGRGHAWWGVHGRGRVWQAGMCGRQDGHCSGRCASYWNSFSFYYMHRVQKPFKLDRIIDVSY